MEKFYFSLAAGSQYKTAKTLQYPYILLNAQSKSNHRPTYKINSLFVDCGGFSSSWKHGGYKTTDQEYLEYLEKIQPDFFALRDYPCEPELLHQYNRTVQIHQDLTLTNHLCLLELLDNYDIKGKWVPVIQGWTIDDYLRCIDLYREHGLITDYIAVGSVCRRTRPRIIQRIILEIHDELPGVRLHGFGVKFSILRDHATWNALYSVDSGAWDYAARWRKYKEGGNKGDLSLKEAEKYQQKIEYLREFHRGQGILNFV